MDNVFEPILKYGFHDTELTSIEEKGFNIVLNFAKGLYLLDSKGKESNLTDPLSIYIQINSYFNSLDQVIEIREFDKKIKYIDYSAFKNKLKRDPYQISMIYYSNFNNSIFFDGGFRGKQFFFSIEGINNLSVSKSKE